MGLKLKTRESIKSLIFLRKTHILAPERGPKWVPNRPRIASKMREGAESFKNRVQEGSERAPRAKKSSLGSCKPPRKEFQDELPFLGGCPTAAGGAQWGGVWGG